MSEYFVQVLNGKRLGEIWPVINLEGNEIVIDTEVGDICYFRSDVKFVDSECVRKLIVPYFGKEMDIGYYLFSYVTFRDKLMIILQKDP